MRIERKELPDTAVLEPPLKCVHVNEKWVQPVLDLVSQLQINASWKPGTDFDRAKQEARDLEEALRNADDCEVNECLKFAPYAPFIEYEPNDPFQTPDLIPDGYTKPPWYVVNTVDIVQQLVGTHLGDVACDITSPTSSLANVLPASGLPRFKVHVQGPSRVQIVLGNVRLGGRAMVTYDREIASQYLLDLILGVIVPGANDGILDVNMDTFALPPENDDTIIIDHTFETEGAHYINVIMMPNINDEVPFLYFGGALRSVEICAESVYPMIVRTKSTNNGTLEQQQPDGSWLDIGRFVPIKDPDAVSEVGTSGRFNHVTDNAEFMRLYHPVGGVPYYSFNQNTLYMPSRLTIQEQETILRPTVRLQPKAGDASLQTAFSLDSNIPDNYVAGNFASETFIRQYDYLGSTLMLWMSRLNGEPRLGFLGATPIPKPTISGNVYGSGVANLINALAGYGLVTADYDYQDIPQGPPGPPGEPGDPSAGNTLPNPPQSGSQELCNAAHYIADRLLDTISDTWTDAQTLTVGEILQSFLNLAGGWDAGPLATFINFINANTSQSDLITRCQNIKNQIVEHIYCSALDSGTFQFEAENGPITDATARNAYVEAFKAADGGKIATWAFVGSTIGGFDCSSFACAGAWSHTWDFTVGDDYTDGLEHHPERFDYPGHYAQSPVVTPNYLYAQENVDLGGQIMTIASQFEATIVSVQIQTYCHASRLSIGHPLTAIYLNGVQKAAATNGGTNAVTHNVSWTPATPQLGLVGFNITVPCNDGQQDAIARLQKITISGIGPDPFV